jgi:hypothetical protein
MVTPIPYGISQVRQNEPAPAEGITPNVHPLLLAKSWLDQMSLDAKITQTMIARREGLSRARVTQIMNLLRLPAEIQNHLPHPPTPLAVGAFSERRLRGS